MTSSTSTSPSCALPPSCANAPVLIIGLGPGGAAGLNTLPPDLITSLLRVRPVICGGKGTIQALQNQYPDHAGEYLPITADISGLIRRMQACLQDQRQILVLADGDALYFGIGATLLKYLPRHLLAFLPAVSSVQAAAACIGLPWYTCIHLSLHGRDAWQELASASLTQRPIALLLDHRTHPHDIATFLHERGRCAYMLHVFTELDAYGAPRFHAHASITDLANDTVTMQIPSGRTLAILIPEHNNPCPKLTLGLPDDAYEHEAGLITKHSVRAAVLASLRLNPADVAWDLGSGSGSVALEASTLAYAGTIHAVERMPERADCIRRNRKKFGAANIEVYCAAIQDIVESLPSPNAVFIGGGLGQPGQEDRARALLQAVWQRVKPGGRLTVSCVLLDSLGLCLHTQLAGYDGTPEILQINLSSGSPLAGSVQLKGLNPVTLVTWEKSHGVE